MPQRGPHVKGILNYPWVLLSLANSWFNRT